MRERSSRQPDAVCACEVLCPWTGCGDALRERAAESGEKSSDRTLPDDARLPRGLDMWVHAADILATPSPVFGFSPSHLSTTPSPSRSTLARSTLHMPNRRVPQSLVPV